MAAKYPRKITESFLHSFSANRSGLYAITIVARCRSGAQIGQYGGEDLRVEIDGITFREIPAAAWNGTTLQGFTKMIIFLLPLKIGQHGLKFIPYRGAEIVSEPVVDFINNARNIAFSPNIQAEDGDRRPWYAVILVDLPLLALAVDATARWRKGDSDDIKLIIDGRVQENKFSVFRRAWYWLGNLFKKPKRQRHRFAKNLRRGTHSLELWADRQPTLHAIELDVGVMPRVPTVDDPRLTGDFRNDPEEVLLARLIFGEAENQSREAKIWVGGSVLNRVSGAAWKDTITDVILQSGQYDPFKKTDRRFPVIINPLGNHNPETAQAWRESYEIAQALITGAIQNPTEATHFHGIGVDQTWFMKNVVPHGRFLRQIDDTHFYWSPN